MYLTHSLFLDIQYTDFESTTTKFLSSVFDEGHPDVSIIRYWLRLGYKSLGSLQVHNFATHLLL